ncbi:MAG: hydantoinase/oxoprolinase family protein [Emergencia sp.]
MNIGIGIDTGGTCTDAVIYQFRERKVLACAKTNTTKEDLSKGIARALSKLPQDLVRQAEIIALSTTLATNACVENKGGRGKLILFGVNPDNVKRSGEDYGLTADDSLIFIDSRTKPNGEIVRQPDWEDFRRRIREQLQGCEAAGVVEMFARKSGAVLEKKARDIIGEYFDIPVVCGHELFAENNIIKRGASVLLNARLISIIGEFTAAVKKALAELEISAPFVIVRSDGSLMTEAFARKNPIETLLCGPVASVMGAVTLTSEQNCMVVDVGGTTTDIAFVKNGIPQTVEKGVKIGGFDTFVKGLFVDTFGLGGDSGVTVDEAHRICLQAERVMPVSMAASAWPRLREVLQKAASDRSLTLSRKEEIYLGLRDISESSGYTDEEKALAAVFLQNPLTLDEAGRQLGRTIFHSQLDRLIREGILIRCGFTPTDAMHILGDFTRYDAEAARLAAVRIGRVCGMTPEQTAEAVYGAVKRKLYDNIVRILLEDSFPSFRGEGIGNQMKTLIDETFDRIGREQGNSPDGGFLDVRFHAPAALIGIGAPTHVFLPDVGEMLGAKVVTPEYSGVANALGAVVGNVSAKVIMEVSLNQQDGSYTVFGRGERYIRTSLKEAEELARTLAGEKAAEEARQRGAGASVEVKTEEQEDIVQTDFGPVFMGFKVTATASGEIQLEKERKDT